MSDSYGSTDYNRGNDDLNRSGGDSYGSSRQDDFSSSRDQDMGMGSGNDSYGRDRNDDSSFNGDRDTSFGTSDRFNDRSDRSDSYNTSSGAGDSYGSGGRDFDSSNEPRRNAGGMNMGSGMGTGTGMGMGGGFDGNSSQQSPSGEKRDWLDKGIEGIGSKVGFNISDRNADRAGDFINKEFNERAGRGLPGVQ